MDYNLNDEYLALQFLEKTDRSRSPGKTDYFQRQYPGHYRRDTHKKYVMGCVRNRVLN